MTGARPAFGNNVSHSHRRKYDPRVRRHVEFREER
ncbi:hypothetical protein [Nocardioides pelophilus]|nr:hypothetical protein [Nocardioides pelophilus]